MKTRTPGFFPRLSRFDRVARTFLLGLLLVGCGSLPDSCGSCGADGGRSPVSEDETVSEPLTEPANTISEDAGPEDAGTQTSLCYELVPSIPWSSTDAALETAHRLWGLTPLPRGTNCRLKLYADELAPIARTFTGDGMVGIHINPEVIIESGDCSGKHLFLVDLLVHELGHAYGFTGHAKSGAMGSHKWCSIVEPTAEERNLIGELGHRSFVGPLP